MSLIKNVSPEILPEIENNSKYLIIDVRDENEYNVEHIKNAINIPYENIERGNYKIPSGKIPVLYCMRGGISMMAARKLYENGYEVLNIVGGLNAYKNYKKKSLY